MDGQNSQFLKDATRIMLQYAEDQNEVAFQQMNKLLCLEYDRGYQHGFDQCGQQIRELIGIS